VIEAFFDFHSLGYEEIKRQNVSIKDDFAGNYINSRGVQ